MSKSPGTLTEQFKNKLAMVEQGLLELRDNLDAHTQRSLGSEKESSSDRTLARAQTSEDDTRSESSSDDDGAEPMSPRGVYVQRCQCAAAAPPCGTLLCLAEHD